MAITNGKHIVKEIDGVSCTIIEDKASKERVAFLQSLLQFNKLEVKTIENAPVEGAEKSYTIGVTDLVFNPVIAIYAKKLYTKYGKIVTPNYWNQISTDTNVPYWTIGRSIIDIYKEEKA